MVRADDFDGGRRMTVARRPEPTRPNHGGTTPMRSFSIGVVLAALVLATSTASGAPLPVLVDTCGQLVPAKAAAYLAADLDCSAFTGATAVELGKRATFDLGGFTLMAGELYGV